MKLVRDFNEYQILDMSEGMKLEDLTIKEVCSCLAILNKLQEEGIVNIDLKTTRATINGDKTTEYLENQNVKLQERINKAIEYIENMYGNEIEFNFKREQLLKILKGEE